MNILVATEDNLDQYPPVATLTQALLELGHNVTLICCHGDLASEEITRNPKCSIVDLGSRANGSLLSLKFDSFFRKKINDLIHDSKPQFDVIWTCSVFTARDAGPVLLSGGHRHVMQLMELIEDLPAFTHRYSIPFKSRLAIKMARSAYRVVVPEFNRSFIQQAWWKIPKRPAVLPNKPIFRSDELPTVDERYSSLLRIFESENRKIILYQGGFADDRGFQGPIEAVEKLGKEYALYLMGVRDDLDGDRIRHEVKDHSQIVLIPFVPAPQHLAFTHFGHIGLMPYRPSYETGLSPLNALYCAPNKLWEYSRFGLPMIGSDVPGLTSIFESKRIGITVDIDNADAIVSAIKLIESDYKSYSARSRSFFDSIDVVKTVHDILE